MNSINGSLLSWSFGAAAIRLPLTLLEAGKSKIQVLTHSTTGETLLPGSQTPLLFVSPLSGRGERAWQGLFYKDTNLIHEDSTLMASSPPKAPPPNTITSGVRNSAYEFWGDATIQSKTSMSQN